MDSVVVDRTETALLCIQHLKQRQLPPMTFLPQQDIKVSEIDERLRQEATLVMDVIEYDPAVERGVRFACGNAVVTETDAEARALCYERGIASKAVALNGVIVEKRGAISGGLGGISGKAHRWEATQLSQLERDRDSLHREVRPPHWRCTARQTA